MTRRHFSSQPSQRQRRVNELIRHAMSDIFLRVDITDDALAGVTITATEVEASPDLRNARVYVVPLGGSNQKIIVDALNRHQKFLRGELARKVELKYTPALTFALDTTFDQSDRVDEILRSRKVAQDLR